jgi:hypothetical protein
MAVGTASDYAALLKEHQAKQAGVKKWEDIFLQPYQTAAEQVSTQTQYDISGAFAQYKKSQLSAMQNMQLGTGFKEQISSDLASQYGSAYSQLRQKEASKLGELQTSYLQTLAQQEEALTEQGERFAEIESALYDYMGITDTSLLEQAYGADGGLGFFEMTEPGSYKITERGIDAFDKALNDYYNATEKDRGQLFTDYLAEQDVELLDWYKQNSGLVRKLVGGLEAGDVSYDVSEREIEKNEAITDIRKYYSSYLSDKEYADVYEEYSDLTEIKNKVDYAKEIAHKNPEYIGNGFTSKRMDFIVDNMKNYYGVDDMNIVSDGKDKYYELQVKESDLTPEQLSKLKTDGYERRIVFGRSAYDKNYYILYKRYKPKQMSDELLKTMKQ